MRLLWESMTTIMLDRRLCRVLRIMLCRLLMIFGRRRQMLRFLLLKSVVSVVRMLLILLLRLRIRDLMLVVMLLISVSISVQRILISVGIPSWITLMTDGISVSRRKRMDTISALIISRRLLRLRRRLRSSVRRFLRLSRLVFREWLKWPIRELISM